MFPRINQAMTDYVARRLALPHDEASALRVHYWRRYGATLLGLIRHHDVDPHEFLREAHPFPDLHRLVARDHGLRRVLRRLPGRKIVVTNGPAAYAAGVLRALVAPLVDDLSRSRAMPSPAASCPSPRAR